MANSLCHHYDRDNRQQTGFSPAVSTLLKLKWEKRPLGEEAAKSLFWPQSFRALCQGQSSPLWTRGSIQCQWKKQLHPTGVVLPPPPTSGAAQCQMLDGNYRQTRLANHCQSNVCPALWNSHHVTVFTAKVNYILACRLKFPHLFSIAQITSSDKTEPNF